MGFRKKLPKIVAYRDYKNFDGVKFRHDVSSLTLDQFDVSNFKETIFNEQRNFCKKRLVTAKKLYCGNVGFKKVVDNSF